jgi:hypothetical protein
LRSNWRSADLAVAEKLQNLRACLRAESTQYLNLRGR